MNAGFKIPERVSVNARPDKTMIKRGILAKNFKKNTLEKIADTAVLMLSL